MTIEDKVKQVLMEILDVEEDKYALSAHLRKDLNASSVDMVEIMAAFENDYDIQISEEEAEELLTVQAIVDYLKNRVG
ncbi:MAG: acyl carrier protein [Desulfobacteraceae bacterium]